MSGGIFDYKQYCLDEIIETIEDHIKQAKAPKPPKVTKRSIAIYKYENPKCKYNDSYISFKSIDEAIEYYKLLGYFVVSDIINEDNLREIICENIDPTVKTKLDIHEFIYECYEDDEYYLEYTDETISELNKGLDIIKKANIYINRIDYLFAGDDGEESFHKRLKEELNKN